EQIYFGILILDEQIRQADLLIDDLRLSMITVSSMYKGGIANQTDVDAVNVDQITTAQEKTGMEATRKAYITMLSIFIGAEIADDETFEMPETDDVYPIQNNRPELALYDAQNRLLDERLKAINSELRPHLGVFAQGGYANPALNMFKNGFKAYYKIGATLSWNFGSFYTRGNDKRKIDVERQTIESERETFLFNTKLQSELEGGEIDRLRKQIKQDEEIISLRENIRSKSEMKVENGTETVNEMLRDINAVSEARLQKSLHEVQLLQEIYKLKNINNN
ncbi:MAG: transporter, partial [Prevotella sp.]|nr:transporter [Prevotella sp.]